MDKWSQEAAVTVALRTTACAVICLSGGRLVYLNMPATPSPTSGEPVAIGTASDSGAGVTPIAGAPAVVPEPDPVQTLTTNSTPNTGGQREKDRAIKMIGMAVENRITFLAALGQSDDSEQLQTRYLNERFEESLGRGMSCKGAVAEILTPLVNDVLRRANEWPGKLPEKGKAAGMAIANIQKEFDSL